MFPYLIKIKQFKNGNEVKTYLLNDESDFNKVFDYIYQEAITQLKFVNVVEFPNAILNAFASDNEALHNIIRNNIELNKEFSKLFDLEQFNLLEGNNINYSKNVFSTTILNNNPYPFKLGGTKERVVEDLKNQYKALIESGEESVDFYLPIEFDVLAIIDTMNENKYSTIYNHFKTALVKEFSKVKLKQVFEIRKNKMIEIV